MTQTSATTEMIAVRRGRQPSELTWGVTPDGGMTMETATVIWELSPDVAHKLAMWILRNVPRPDKS